MPQPLPIRHFTAADRARVRGVLYDLDDSFTTRVRGRGQILSSGVAALERVAAKGKYSVPVTGRPFGWVDHIARMWPVNAVVGENGGFYSFYRNERLQTRYMQADKLRHNNRRALDRMGRDILKHFPGTRIASDQAARVCDLAIDFAEDVAPALPLERAQEIAAYFEERGAHAKASSIHVNGWFGEYDKLSTTRRLFQDLYDIDLQRSQNQFAFIGDSLNDEPMFAFFSNGIGVANVLQFLPTMKSPPVWITTKASTAGFVEAVNALLR